MKRKFSTEDVINHVVYNMPIINEDETQPANEPDFKDAPWITSEVKTAIKRNDRVYRKWVIRGREPNTRDKIREVQHLTNKMIKQGNQNYFEKLGDKRFWTAFKRLLNK